jgi:hypothetical protein
MKYVAGALGLVVAFAAEGCSSATIENGGGSGGAGAGSGPLGGAGGASSGPPVSIDLDAAVTMPDLRKDDLPPDAKPYRCDDAGNCNICLAILSLGLPGSYGAGSGSSDNTDAFQKFMNNNTSGTAHMVMQTTFTSLTADLLNQYDVVILQFLGNNVYSDYGIWNYQQSDVDALNQWVNEKGGAIIAMSGYSGVTAEVNPLNQLVAPYGISYNTDTIFDDGACPDGLCYCSYSSIPFNTWIANTPDCAGITTNHDNTTLGKVGIFKGRSINCTGGGCNVFAKDPKTGANVGVGKLVGSGRIFALADEWVTYTSQWGLTPDTSQSAYDDPNKSPQCVGHTPYQSYVVPQFWYNVFKWTVPNAACFTIDQPPNPGQTIIY